ncbi:MAG: hypothetical protein EOO82_01795, partial [Oxalobacteraceae bacterium]
MHCLNACLSGSIRQRVNIARFAALTVRIVRGIQWVLQQMYAIINKNYMSLSREMEFHADAVAARVSGSNSLIKALERLELADAGYTAVLGKYSNLFREKKVADNLYRDHRMVMQLLSNEQKLAGPTSINGIEDNTHTQDFFVSDRVQNRINYKDQWASHPPIGERTRQLAALNIIAEQNDDTAWTLFTNKPLLEEELTKKIYAGIEIPDEATAIDAALFHSHYTNEQEANRLPAVFGNYFTDREIADLNIAEIIKGAADKDPHREWQQLVTRQNLNLPARIAGLRSDINILDN